ncbi:MAG: C25 family cysteine peptidase, partial [Candidatus Marinimicrobia bacterium]|nr:C25 family cysteine peptidase [Candidatus Neomarinimicrobiota bacterium]
MNRIFPYILFLAGLTASPPSISLISSTETELVFRVETEAKTKDDLKPISVVIGIPDDAFPELLIAGEGLRTFANVPGKTADENVRWIQKQKLRSLHTATLEISPAVNMSQYFSSIIVTVRFPESRFQGVRANKVQTNFLSGRILNWNTAKNWFLPRQLPKAQLSAEFTGGTWISFTVHNDDAYFITGSTLLGISGISSAMNPQSFQLFTGSAHGRDRTYSFTQGTQSEQTIPDNLTEVAVSFSGEDNAVLDASDTLFFYGRGASGFDNDAEDIDYHQNLYFTENTYWLFIPDDTSQRGLRIAVQDLGPSSLVSLSYGLVYKHFEYDLLNPFESGLSWVGSSIAYGSSYATAFSLGTPNTSVSAAVQVGLYGGEASSTSSYSTSHLIQLYLGSTSGSSLGYLAWTGLRSKEGSFAVTGLTPGTNTFFLKNESSSSNSKPYMDYMTLSYGMELASSETYEFFAPLQGNTITFTFDGIPDMVWDITDPAQPQQLIVAASGGSGSVSLNLAADTTHRFLTINTDDRTEIADLVVSAENPFASLRIQHSGSNHLIIGPQLFSEEAADLVSHRSHSMYVNLEDIYAEFSAGNADPVAIKFFIQWTQENWTTKPNQVFLLGDADYDYRNISGESKNKVPTIQVGSSSSSRATDDRLATIYGTMPEVALGRFPAQSESEVSDYIAKVISYESSPVPGLWRQRVTLVADDGARPENDMNEISTGKSHTNNSEDLDDIVPASVEVQKLYMLEYPEVSDASTYGVSKPDATDALFQTLNDGTAIINYIGHGSSS